MNKYLIHIQDTGKSYGPFQIMCRDCYRCLDVIDWAKAQQLFGLYETVHIVDPNGSVILGNMIIDRLSSDHLGIVVSIVPKHNIFP